MSEKAAATANSGSILETIPEFTVLGYSPGKTKDGRPYVRLDLFVRNNPRFGGEGFNARAVFLPDNEHHKAAPWIVGTVCHCDTDMFGNRSNFVFVDGNGEV